MGNSAAEDNRAAYAEICTRYRAIDDFRAKLLGFLPLASGAGIFLLLSNVLTQEKPPVLPVRFLLPVGVFGLAVTLGLYFYELRGIQYCVHLIVAGRVLEEKLGIRGAFSTRPKQHVGGFISEILAAHVIYGAVLAAWTFVASVFAFSGSNPAKPAILPASALALFVVIVVMGITCQMNLRPDLVWIMAISPFRPVLPGAPTEFTIKVGIDLKSAKTGIAQVGFNLNSPESFEIVECRKLRGGTQQVTFTATVTPVDWRDVADFAVAVNIGPDSTAQEWTPTVSLQRSISCAKSAEGAAVDASLAK